MDSLKLKALSKIEIFQDLSDHEMQEMDRATTMNTCEPGRVFYGPDEKGEVLFLLKKGRVQLYRLSPEGKKIIVAILEEGAIFGEMAFIGQGMHNTFAEALEECLLCVMSRVDVERIVKNKPEVAMRFMESMGRRIRDLETKVEDIAFRSIPSRLAALLIQLAESSDSSDLVEGFTHQDLAEMLGTYRETATQTLNDFKAQGWINIGRMRIEILNIPALEEQSSH
jgi:CRP-like cAMP-binding protein